MFSSSPIPKDHISILLGSRGRPALLERFFESVAATVTNPRRIEVAVYFDDDDLPTQQCVQDATTKYPFPVRPHSATTPAALGNIGNILWKTSPHRGGIFAPAVDDFVYSTVGWDEMILEAFSRYPDRVAMIYPPDPGGAECATTPILSDQWLSLLGYFYVGYFPFWFDDVWIDEVAQMVQRRHPIPTIFLSPGGKGKTMRMRNLIFWQRFYLIMIVERLAAAKKLRKQLYPAGSEEFRNSELLGLQLAQSFIAKHDHSDESLFYIERDLRADTDWNDPRMLARYMSIETGAVNRLVHLLSIALRHNDSGTVGRILGALRHSATRLPEIDALRERFGLAANYHELPRFELREDDLLNRS